MYLLFDIGGTKTRLAVSKNGKTFSNIRIIPTPKNFNEGIAAIKNVAKELSADKKIKAVCGGIAGTLDRSKNILLQGKNIQAFVGKPIKTSLEKIFKCKVFVENDSALAGLGETIYGAGRGNEIVAYITVSTGVGGARIVNGKIDPAHFSFEPGYQIIDAGGRLCKICNGRHLGAHISGNAIRKHFKKYPKEIKDLKIKNDLARWLAIGLNNSIVHWSPDTVVLGGSVMNIIPLKQVRTNLKNILKVYPKLPKIKKAALGDLGGLYGALVFLKR